MTKYEIRRWIPLKIQRFIRARRFKDEFIRNEKTRKEILNYYQNTTDEEILEIVNYLKDNPLTFFNYKFSDYAYKKKIIMFFDNKCGMFYTNIDGKRLYFKRNMDANSAQNYICSIICEQNKLSPHSYHIEELLKVKESINIIDLGGAEGYFALRLIDKAERVYVVECDNEWIEALKMTFLPWKNKVNIISKAVGSSTTDKMITLSSLLEFEMRNIIKMDIEGMEVTVLREMMKTSVLERCFGTRIIVCVYHNARDEEDIKSMFSKENVEININSGYIFFTAEQYYKPPYFRRGVMFISQKEKA